MNKTKKAVLLMVLISFVLTPLSPVKVKDLIAASNLIDGGSFEGDIENFWGLWVEPESQREFQFYRDYEAPFAYGSYSAVLEVGGGFGDEKIASVSTKPEKSFYLESGVDYVLSFYAKANNRAEILPYLQNATDYSANSEIKSVFIDSQDWKKYTVYLSPNNTGENSLSMIFPNTPDNTIFHIDGVQLFKHENSVNTTTVSGYIGDNKSLSISNLNNYELDEIEIILPFYDGETDTNSIIRVRPTSKSYGTVKFNMPEGSFSGIGTVLINDIEAGKFNYFTRLKLNKIHPEQIRLNNDLVISAKGFSPVENATFLIVDSYDHQGGRSEQWLRPKAFSDNLDSLIFEMPAKLVSGSMYLYSSSLDMENEEEVNKSNTVSYKVRPSITNTYWATKGYEQVGDKISIEGYGFGTTPQVKYYNQVGDLIDTKRADVEYGSEGLERISVETTEKESQFIISVESGGVESDVYSAQPYDAKPLLEKIYSGKNRKIGVSGESISAAKNQEIISLSGSGFQNSDSLQVEFEGSEGRIVQDVDLSSLNLSGNKFDVVVPNAAVTGFIAISANGSKSNYMPLEIIPSIVSTSPENPEAGQMTTIIARGVGKDISKTKIHLSFGREKRVVEASSVEHFSENSNVYFSFPRDMSYNEVNMNIQYGAWMDDSEQGIEIRPKILRAGINMDTKVLSIVGQGFSLRSDENTITYKYANEEQTVVDPKRRVLGVYPTEEGQEIRIQIMDDYHFGRLSVKVGSYSSNEVNFGPITISSVARRTEYVENAGTEMGVLYIRGYNFGSDGGVLVGQNWADIHYRSDFLIIAVVPKENINDGPVLIARR